MIRAKFFLCVAIASSIATAQTPPSPGSPSAATFFRQPPVFVENRGQWEGDFIYKTSVGAMTVFVQRSGWTFTLVEGKKDDAADKHELLRTMKHEEDEIASAVAVGMHFVGTAGAEDLVPGARGSGVHNYLLGNDPTGWRTDVPLYEAVRLARIWPGVDVDARIEHSRFEYDVIVSPGADLSQVVIEVEGAEGLRLEADGTLVIDTVLGPVRQPRARTWQVMPEGEREPVACDYVLLDAARFGFSAPAWDRGRPLVIDPALLYSTYLGGGNRDFASAVAVDASGAAIVAGYTDSTNFPTTSGAFSVSLNGISDAFVTRLNSAGNGLLYSTYLGGGNGDSASAVAVDASGAATLAGSTNSTNFPTTSGAFAVSLNGSGDAFVTRLNSTGNGLLSSTYLGGANSDYASAVAVDASGAVTLTGGTDSTNFPTTPGAYDTSHNGLFDVFVARLTPAAAGLLYSTYLGGSGDDYAVGAIDASGAATVAGVTYSADFPTTPGAWNPSFNGGWPDGTDAFVARLNATGSGLLYSTYLGGGWDDAASAVAVDASGAATVAGYTISLNFPTTPGAYDTSFSGWNYDPFVARLNPTGTGLVYSTYLGGPAIANAVAVDASGAATVAGGVHYNSSGSFPTTPGAYDTTHNGGQDVFVARLNPTGTGLVYSTYLGGAGYDYSNALALDASGAATVAGYTDSTNFPTTSGAYDPSFNGGSQDAFVARLQLDDITVDPPPAGPVVYVSFSDVVNVPGVGNVDDEDIVRRDSAGAWSLYFDGSDVGLSATDITAFEILPSGQIAMVFDSPSFNVPGLSGGPNGATVTWHDIVLFTPTSLGATTAGSFSFYFDGSDVALTQNAEAIDALAIDASGAIFISTTGNPNLPGLTGLADEDVMRFVPSALGSVTSCTWSWFFDGSDVGFSNSASEDLDACALSLSGQLRFSTVGGFAAAGASGDADDIGQFSGTFGSTTSGTSSILLDLSALGIPAANVDGLATDGT